ncbi:MAG: hypothetical protein QNJ11_02780 [Woeseiaceae bacterium]|nr:hypothetical protein [Woeseiaceae bacterium]
MGDHILTAIHLMLVSPCLFLGMYFYRKQCKELDARQRIYQRLAIAWCAMIFVIISLSVDHLWTTYVIAN